MKVVDIANDIWYSELNETTDTSIAAIAFWIRSNVGKLNQTIGTDYIVNDISLEIVDKNGMEIGSSEVAILKTLYLIYWYNRQAKNFLGVSSANLLLEVTSDGATVRTINKNEIAKSYIALVKEAKDDLRGLVNNYVLSLSTPLQVVGDDTDYTITSSRYVRRREL